MQAAPIAAVTGKVCRKLAAGIHRSNAQTHTVQLQGKFIAASVPAISATLLLVGWFVYSSLLENRTKALHSEIALASDRIDVRLHSYLQDLETNAHLLADASPIIEWFGRSESHFFGPRIKRQVESQFKRVRLLRPQIRELKLVDARGREQVRVADRKLINRSENETSSRWFTEVAHKWWSSSHTVIGPHEDDGKATLTAVAPVRLNSDEENNVSYQDIVGYVVADVLMETAAETISQKLTGHDGYVMIMTEDLEMIYQPKYKHYDARLLRDALGRQNRIANYDGDVTELNVNGEPRLIRQHLVQPGLVAVVAFPTEALRSIRNQVAAVVACAILLSVIGFSLLYTWLVHRLVIAPISKLQENVHAFSRGNHEIPRYENRNDEIGRLSRAFADMSHRLSKSLHQLKETGEEFERLANHDGLTGLPNRRRFQQILDERLEHAIRLDSKVSIMFIDLNKFKLLNDTHGHHAGDQLLITTATRLKTSFSHLQASGHRFSHIDFHAARLAGDEFIVLLSGFTDISIVEIVADRLIEDLCQVVDLGDAEWSLDASVGIALYPDHAATSNSLLSCADHAMYTAKIERRPCWRMYKADTDDEQSRAA